MIPGRALTVRTDVCSCVLCLVGICAGRLAEVAMPISSPQALTCLLEKKHGFTYEYFHGPARSQGLAEVHPGGSEDSDMSGVVKNITYGELWSNKSAKKTHGE